MKYPLRKFAISVLAAALCAAIVTDRAPAVTANPLTGLDAICQQRSKLVTTLITEYGEQLAEAEGTGMGVLEFYVSPASGTWTALITDEIGISCIIGTGDGIDPAKAIPGMGDYEA